ncbi:hypothetical protein pb186bvf_003101 [Paramecium bursaria]
MSVKIHLYDACLTKDVRVFTKMCPYAELKLGQQNAKSSICKKGGTAPKWNDEFTLLNDGKSELVIKLYDFDKEVKFIGEAALQQKQLNYFIGSLPVFNAGKIGELKVMVSTGLFPQTYLTLPTMRDDVPNLLQD